MLEAQTSDLNQDGSITIKVGDKDVQFVKESDLGAVKANLANKESEVSKLQLDLTTANTGKDESHQSMLKEKAARELLEKDVTTLGTTKEALTKLEAEMADAVKVSGDVSTKLTDRVRKYLIDSYKIDADKIKDKSLVDLEQIETTLTLTGAVPSPANYDGKGNGGAPAGLEGKSPLALATMGYEQSGKSK